MKLRQAITKSITGFYAGKLPQESLKTSERDFVYTLDFFEELEKMDPEEAANAITEETTEADL